MIGFIFFSEHVVSGSLSGKDKISPVSYDTSHFIIIHMVETILVTLESAIVLQEVIAHHVSTAVSVSSAETHHLIDHLRKIGPHSVLITSIRIDGQPSVAGYNHLTDEYFSLPYTEIPVHFPGTGDIFSAVLIGHLLHDEPLEESTRQAMDAVWKLIDLNKDNADKNRGIPLEQYLNIL